MPIPGTIITEDVELVESGGTGGGRPPRASRDGGGGDSHFGSPAVPQRAYVTGMTVALAGILMFFMALTSAYIVRKGLSNDWRPLALPKILWLNTVILVASSGTIFQARRKLAG